MIKNDLLLQLGFKFLRLGRVASSHSLNLPSSLVVGIFLFSRLLFSPSVFVLSLAVVAAFTVMVSAVLAIAMAVVIFARLFVVPPAFGAVSAFVVFLVFFGVRAVSGSGAFLFITAVSAAAA